MAPESNDPLVKPPVTPDTSAHPEGAYTFNNVPLDHVADYHLGNIPETPGSIDPITGNVDFSRIDAPTLLTTPVIQPEHGVEQSGIKPEATTSKWRRWAAIGLGSSVLVGGGFMGANILDNDDPKATPEAKPTQSASASPSPEVTPVSIELSGIVTQPSAEVIEYTRNNPILAEGGTPTAEGALQAAITMGDYMNVYRNSGQLDGFSLSSESIQAGEDILNMVYGPLGVRNSSGSPDLVKMQEERESIAAAFATYSGLESNSRWQPTGEQPVEMNQAGITLWEVNLQTIRSGNWDAIGETPERNLDWEGSVYLSTYDSPKGLAWYFYSGETVQTAADIS